MRDARRSNWPADIAIGLSIYALTALPVALGLILALTPDIFDSSEPPNLLIRCCHFDGAYYKDIISEGYWYDVKRGSAVAFFPGYPLAASIVMHLGFGVEHALVLTANLALAAAFIVLSAYLRARSPGEPLAARLATLGLIGLCPAGFFFRMGYSESMMLLVLALVLLGLTRRWPVVVLALLAGLATGIRPVGLAATAAVAVSVLSDPDRGSIRRRVAIAAGVGFLGCWGLLAYMGYLQAQFGDFTVFIRTQQNWAFYKPGPGDIPTKFARLVLAEPIWNAYVPGSSRYWSTYEINKVPVLGLQFWNPIFFTLAVVAVIVGWCRGWLSRPEAVLGLALLLIPYVTRADEMSMGSHARFASVVIPAFVVAGRALSRWPPAVWAVFALLSPILTLWTALFAAGWPMC